MYIDYLRLFNKKITKREMFGGKVNVIRCAPMSTSELGQTCIKDNRFYGE